MLDFLYHLSDTRCMSHLINAENIWTLVSSPASGDSPLGSTKMTQFTNNQVSEFQQCDKEVDIYASTMSAQEESTLPVLCNAQPIHRGTGVRPVEMSPCLT